MLFFAPRRGMSRISIRMRFFSMTDITRNACKHRQYPLSESIYTKKCSMSCCLDDHHKRPTLMERCRLKIAQLECKVQQRLHRHCIKLTADFKVCPFDPHLKSSYTTFPSFIITIVRNEALIKTCVGSLTNSPYKYKRKYKEKGRRRCVLITTQNRFYLTLIFLRIGKELPISVSFILSQF